MVFCAGLSGFCDLNARIATLQGELAEAHEREVAGLRDENQILRSSIGNDGRLAAEWLREFAALRAENQHLRARIPQEATLVQEEGNKEINDDAVGDCSVACASQCLGLSCSGVDPVGLLCSDEDSGSLFSEDLPRPGSSVPRVTTLLQMSNEELAEHDEARVAQMLCDGVPAQEPTAQLPHGRFTTKGGLGLAHLGPNFAAEDPNPTSAAEEITAGATSASGMETLAAVHQSAISAGALRAQRFAGNLPCLPPPEQPGGAIDFNLEPPEFPFACNSTFMESGDGSRPHSSSRTSGCLPAPPEVAVSCSATSTSWATSPSRPEPEAELDAASPATCAVGAPGEADMGGIAMEAATMSIAAVQSITGPATAGGKHVDTLPVEKHVFGLPAHDIVVHGALCGPAAAQARPVCLLQASRPLAKTATCSNPLKRFLRLPTEAKVAAKRRSSLPGTVVVCVGPQPSHVAGAALHPFSPARLAWDIACGAFIGCDIVVGPLQLLDLPTTAALKTLSWIGGLFWAADIGASFSTGVYMDGKLVLQSAEIARRFGKTWLYFDLGLVLCDFAALCVFSAGSQRVRCAFGLVKLLRVARLEPLLQKLFVSTNSKYVQLNVGVVRLLVSLAIACHVAVCIWYRVGASRADGWVHNAGQNLATPFHKYVASLYLLVTRERLPRGTVATDHLLTRINALECVVTVVVMFFAAALLAALLGSIISAAMQFNLVHYEQIANRSSLRGYLKDRRVSVQLSASAQMYLQSQKPPTAEASRAQLEVLGKLPLDMLMDIHEGGRSPLLAAHPFFRNLRIGHPYSMRTICYAALAEVPTWVGDDVFTVGESCSRMLFVDRGTLIYVISDVGGEESTVAAQPPVAEPWKNDGLRSGGRVQHMTTGATEVVVSPDQWTSEPALWIAWNHRGDLRALSLGRLLALDVASFAAVIARDKAVNSEAASYARRFIEYIKCGGPLSDLMEPDPMMGTTTYTTDSMACSFPAEACGDMRSI